MSSCVSTNDSGKEKNWLVNEQKGTDSFYFKPLPEVEPLDPKLSVTTATVNFLFQVSRIEHVTCISASPRNPDTHTEIGMETPTAPIQLIKLVYSW